MVTKGVLPTVLEVGRLVQCGQIEHPAPKPSRGVEPLAVSLFKIVYPGSPLLCWKLPSMRAPYHSRHEPRNRNCLRLLQSLQLEFQVPRS
jgi:hypothetical protein